MGFFDKLTGKNKATNTAASTGIQWNNLTTETELEALVERSHSVPCVIFKHSTRCSISSMAHNRFERNWNIEAGKVETYYLDLIAYRSVSNKIAETLGVVHQSPQVILLKDGIVVYDTSHNDISVEAIKENL